MSRQHQKPKKRKPAKKRGVNRNRRFDLFLPRVVIYDAHCLDKQEALIPVFNRADHLQFTSYLTTARHYWQIRLVVFCKDQFGVEYQSFESVPHLGEEAMTKDKAGSLCENVISDFVAKQNPKHYVSAGWFATPYRDAAIEDLDQVMAKKLINAGAYDPDIFQISMSVRRDNERHMIEVEPNSKVVQQL